ncbi:MAG: DUF3883 domain-containing protein [Candidatus Portnoybacteria bacterium]|jgi:hypothetical protein|nr:DUF3883 domain-containing protein [Candidatus Portnoybacteria bacterium]
MDLEQYKNEEKRIKKNKDSIIFIVNVAFVACLLFLSAIFLFLINNEWQENVFILFGLSLWLLSVATEWELNWILKHIRSYRVSLIKLENCKNEIKRIEEQEEQKTREKLQEKRKECSRKLDVLKDIYGEIFNKKISLENIDSCQKFIEIANNGTNAYELLVYSLDPKFDRGMIKEMEFFRQYAKTLQSRTNIFFEKEQNGQIENRTQPDDKKETQDGASQERNIKLVESDTLESSPVRFIENKYIDKFPTKRIKIDFLEKNKKNTELGLRGELIVLDWEKEALIKEGLGNLAKKVKHISREFGDGFGFDILSFNKDGSDKFIEVKTTKKGIDSQFYFSENELNFIKDNQNYYLYRLKLQDENEAELTIINRDDFINKFEIFPYQYIVKLKEQ